MAVNDGFMQSPWWTTVTGVEPDDYIAGDYTRGRSSGVTYTMDDLIGRHDYIKTTDPATASGTPGTILI